MCIYNIIPVQLITTPIILIMLNIHRHLLALLSTIKIHPSHACKQAITTTLSTIQQAAEVTLGPYGRTVLIEGQLHQPRITKDGITVVKNMEFEGRLEEAIAVLVKRSVDGTNKYAGDGTTTSTVLIGEIMRRAARRVAAGASSRDIRKGFEIGRGIGLEFVDSCARKIEKREQLMNVAMISTNGKQPIARLVVEALTNSQKVRIEKSKKMQNTIEYRTGLTIGRGIQSMDFSNNSTDKLVYNYPYIVTSQQPLRSTKQVLKCLQMAKKARKQLLIFAPQFSDSVKSTLIYNNKKKIIECGCVCLPQIGSKGAEFLRDIAKATNSHLFSQFGDVKIEDMSWQHFGKAAKIEASLVETKIETTPDSKNNNVQAVILVGGPNETVLLQNYDHMIDALNSTKSAMQDGVVAGGGLTLWRLGQLLQAYEGEGQEGVRILAEACRQPRKKLMQFIPAEKKPLSGELWQGYDLKTEKIVDMFDAGIIDSVNVVKSTIIDSLSLCTVLVEVELALARTDKNYSTLSLKDLNRKYSQI